MGKTLQTKRVMVSWKVIPIGGHMFRPKPAAHRFHVSETALKWSLTMDLATYEQHDLTARLHGYTLKIIGYQEVIKNVGDQTHIKRQSFVHEVLLPKTADTSTLRAVLGSNGHLTVHAEKHPRSLNQSKAAAPKTASAPHKSAATKRKTVKNNH